MSCIEAIEQITANLNQKYTLPLELKISVGVNTGSAMLGNLGSSDRTDYTAAEDTVNLALALRSGFK